MTCQEMTQIMFAHRNKCLSFPNFNPFLFSTINQSMAPPYIYAYNLFVPLQFPLVFFLFFRPRAIEKIQITKMSKQDEEKKISPELSKTKNNTVAKVFSHTDTHSPKKKMIIKKVF